MRHLTGSSYALILSGFSGFAQLPTEEKPSLFVESPTCPRNKAEPTENDCDTGCGLVWEVQCEWLILKVFETTSRAARSSPAPQTLKLDGLNSEVLSNPKGFMTNIEAKRKPRGQNLHIFLHGLSMNDSSHFRGEASQPCHRRSQQRQPRLTRNRAAYGASRPQENLMVRTHVVYTVLQALSIIIVQKPYIIGPFCSQKPSNMSPLRVRDGFLE